MRHSRPQYWKLIGRLAVPMRDPFIRRGGKLMMDPAVQDEFRNAFEGDRIVAKTDVGPMHVSTVFLVLDQQHSPDPAAPPILFETMIFGGADADGDDQSYQRRYSSWDEAQKGHAEAVEHARKLVAMADAALKTKTSSEQ